MKNEKELFKLIVKYEDFIKIGNTFLMKVYNIDKSPLLAKREGIIPHSGIVELDDIKMNFKFHGMGCRFEFGDITIEFDYSFGDFLYKGFEISKLFWFIESYPNLDLELNNKIIFQQCILKLEQDGIIAKNKNSIDTHDYVLVKNIYSLGDVH